MSWSAQTPTPLMSNPPALPPSPPPQHPPLALTQSCSSPHLEVICTHTFHTHIDFLSFLISGEASHKHSDVLPYCLKAYHTRTHTLADFEILKHSHLLHADGPHNLDLNKPPQTHCPSLHAHILHTRTLTWPPQLALTYAHTDFLTSTCTHTSLQHTRTLTW